MKKIIVIVCILSLSFTFSAFAQNGENQPLNYIGVNLGHPLIVAGVSVASSSIAGDPTFYLPIHLQYAHSLNKHWAVSGQLVYRMEKYGTDYSIHEFGLMAGPRFSFNYLKSVFFEVKIGAGYAFGTDYGGYAYSRLDLAFEPALGFNLILGDVFTMTFGIGVQSLIPLAEFTTGSPYSSTVVDVWTWNWFAGLAHFCLPVANISIGLVF